MSDWKFDPNKISEFEWKYFDPDGIKGDIRKIAEECHSNAIDHGFDVSVKNDQIVALMDELGEWCNAIRSGDTENEQEEVVDMIVRILAYAEQHFKGTWPRALLSKMSYNRGRPWKHGGKKF